MINSSVGTRPRAVRTVEGHLAVVLDMAQTFSRVPEFVQVNEALDRVLAADLKAPWDIPRFAQSAMDGFAVRFADFAENPSGLPITTEIFAGMAPDPLAPNTAARIMTGAPIPSGADTVIRLEDAVVGPAPSSNTMVLRVPSHGSGTNIRYSGEDVRTGATVLVSGTRLSARHLGAIAALGYDSVPVVRKPQITIITTGDELLDLGQQPTYSQIIDSNGPYLMSALTQLGGETRLTRCGDNPEQFEAIMHQALDSDLIVVTGGASVGDRDVAREVLKPQGVDYVSVLMQPGKPQGAGLWNGTPVLSLPGNPVSVAVSCAVFQLPLLNAMLGVEPSQPQWAEVKQGWTSVKARRQYYPVRTLPTPGGLLIEPATPSGAGSHLVTSLAQATNFAIVSEDTQEVHPGDRLELLPIP